MFEQRGFPLTQTHELQLLSSIGAVGVEESLVTKGSYGELVVVFEHTDEGSERTVEKKEVSEYFSIWIQLLELTNFTPNASPSDGAEARETSDPVLARGSTETWLRRALVHVDSAVRTGEAPRTKTAEPPGTGLARPSVVTRLILALIYGFVAERAAPSESTPALRYAGDRRQDARTPIQTLPGKTLHGTIRTVFPGPSGRALAGIIRVTIDTNSTVLARIREALVNI